MGRSQGDPLYMLGVPNLKPAGTGKKVEVSRKVRGWCTKNPKWERMVKEKKAKRDKDWDKARQCL